MLEALKTWMVGEAVQAPTRVLSQWARRGGWRTTLMEDGHGVVMELALGDDSEERMRIHWRAPNPAAAPNPGDLAGGELCVRSELALPDSLQLLAIDRRMADWLDTAYPTGFDASMVYAQEGRWLAMLPRLPLDPDLGRSHLLVASHTVAGLHWMDRELAAKIDSSRRLAGQPCTIVKLDRGRQTVRAITAHLDEALVDWAVAVHRLSIRQARTCASLVMDGAGWPTTISATWTGPIVLPEGGAPG